MDRSQKSTVTNQQKFLKVARPKTTEVPKRNVN